MSGVFARIDPDHPLTEAARHVNAYAEEHGMQQTLDWLEMNVGQGELAYLGEQRALRAVAAAALGMNMGGDAALDNVVAAAVVATPLWRDMRTLLVACYMDGITIGWRGHELATREEAA